MKTLVELFAETDKRFQEGMKILFPDNQEENSLEEILNEDTSGDYLVSEKDVLDVNEDNEW